MQDKSSNSDDAGKPEAGLLTAFLIAFAVHKHQKDKQGRPYWEHVIAVAFGVWEIEDQIVAFLHDTVEDSDGTVTLDTLRRAGFTEDVITAVDLLTRRKADGETYTSYIVRLIASGHLRALRVKRADLQHHLSREGEIADALRPRYRKALAMVEAKLLEQGDPLNV